VAAALAQRRSSRRDDGLHKTNFARDLGQIADLIEVCFAAQMDTGGRSAVNEMKMISQLGPVAWLLALIDRYVAGLGSGFVWRTGGHVVGNVSLYRAGKLPGLGPGWMIANVAVHPDFRRRGIALAMMEATIERARREGGGWITLEVEASNDGALALYDRLGFRRFETLTLWEHPAYYGALTATDPGHWPVRRRRWGDGAAETDLIFGRARQGAMVFTQPIDQQMVSDTPLDLLDAALGGKMRERWVLDDPYMPDRLLGSLWVEAYGWRSARITQFIDPALTDPEGRHSLLAHVLGLPNYDGWTLRFETAEDEVAAVYLGRLGFRQMRALTQMRLDLGETLDRD
jgi:ribosomal protein S18 acetylase RimI-like enzyme